MKIISPVVKKLYRYILMNLSNDYLSNVVIIYAISSVLDRTGNIPLFYKVCSLTVEAPSKM